MGMYGPVGAWLRNAGQVGGWPWLAPLSLDDPVLRQLVKFQVVKGLPGADDRDVCREGVSMELPPGGSPHHTGANFVVEADPGARKG